MHPPVRSFVRRSMILGGVDTGRLCVDPGIDASPWQLVLRFESTYACVGQVHLGYSQMRCFVDVVIRLCHIDQVKQVKSSRQSRRLVPYLMVEFQCWRQFLSSN